MNNREERLFAHAVNLPPGYVPNPEAHLGNVRDKVHFDRAYRWLTSIGARTVLDVGSYDGWLDFLLTGKGFSMTGVELIQDLADAALRYAERNFLPYEVQVGDFLDLNVGREFVDEDGRFEDEDGQHDGRRWDAIICFEMLEHMPLEDAKECARRFAETARKGVLISLPDQKHEDNRQHLWSPSIEIVHEIWGGMPGFATERVAYPSTTIPSNWFVSHTCSRG